MQIIAQRHEVDSENLEFVQIPYFQSQDTRV
jgi:hypothetical protein